jgi:hypothetical protein
LKEINMKSSHIPDSTSRSRGIELAVDTRDTSLAGRIALVTVLAGCIFVAFATRHDTALGQSSPAVTIEPVAQTASTAAEYYFPAHFTNQARSNDGNVTTYEHD